MREGDEVEENGLKTWFQIPDDSDID